MASKPSDPPWPLRLLLLSVWPAKVILVYFITCAQDVVRSLRDEWRERGTDRGWER